MGNPLAAQHKRLARLRAGRDLQLLFPKQRVRGQRVRGQVFFLGVLLLFVLDLPMARPLRLEFDGAIYYITSRGNALDPIFFTDRDRERFLEVLGEIVERYEWLCHAHCLMTNHYHLLIETPDSNLSRGMRQLNGIYTQWINCEYGRSGHVFQGRFKSILVEKEAHLLELARYVVLNPAWGMESYSCPLRANMVGSPCEWPWSSYCWTG